MSIKENTDRLMIPHSEISLRMFIRSLCDVSGVPAFRRRPDGSTDWECGQRFCSFFCDYASIFRACPIVMDSSAETSFKLHEPYIFMCPCELVLIACPSKDREDGTIFIGPMVMDSESDDPIEKLLSYFTGSQGLTSTALTYLSRVRIWSAHEISSLYRILLSYYTTDPVHEMSFKSEVAFAETPDTRRKMPYTDTDYPEDAQGAMLKKIMEADSPAAVEGFRLLYEKNYLMASGNMDILRMQMIEMFNYLCSHLNNESAISYILEHIAELSKADSFNEMYRLAEAMINHLTEEQLTSSGSNANSVVREALRYIHDYYAQNITLSDVSEHVHLTPSYLSMLLRKTTDKTFTQHLTDVRLSGACRMLRETDRSITDIATGSGFSSQSYFIRVFRREFGVTPRQYRKAFESTLS